jgi:two-component system, NtrC family, nitrogen regulation response regulator NtrX
MKIISPNILIVDDDYSVAESIKGVLGDEGYKTDIVGSGEAAIEYYSVHPPDIAIFDIWLPGVDGLSAMLRIKEKFPAAHFIVMSGHGNIETAVKATKMGAYDYIEKPISMEKLLLSIHNLLELINLREENKDLKSTLTVGRFENLDMIGESNVMKILRRQIRTVAETASSVLITGENGTGKELVARLVHQNSERSKEPFIEVNCAAIPEELIESELFGHEKGAFTGAVSTKRGKFDLASGGTLFLDEIGDMSLRTQAKILRILEEQKFERVGGNEQIKVDVRVIAATNKDLKALISTNNFRADLYFRLNVLPLVVPSLRERGEDIALLVNYYMRLFSERYGKQIKDLSDDAADLLYKYEWPGNVRELRNIVERLVIMTKGIVIDSSHLPAEISKKDIPVVSAPLLSGTLDPLFKVNSLKEAKELFENEFIKRKLEENKGNVSQTASAIGVERSSIHRKMRKSK